ncbi:MAG: PTS sugar transporter subunit IIC [Oscillospiraceae bacterium]|nr:PTS sugar transporter subunit IIC [Oscillospiraceae bacterium]
MLLQAILLAVIVAVAVGDEATLQLGFFRPVFIGAASGAVMGNFTAGVIIGASMELIFASGQIGAYIPPDPIIGTAIGTAVGILSNTDAAGAIAVGLPVAILGQQLKILAYTINITFVHKAERDADNADLSKIGLYHFSGLAVQCVVMALPVFFAVLFGVDKAASLIDRIPESLMTGLTIASKILPALGMGMLLSMMMNKKTWAFLLVGFVGAAYFSLPTIGCALVGLAAAVICDVVIGEARRGAAPAAAAPADKEEVDL